MRWLLPLQNLIGSATTGKIAAYRQVLAVVYLRSRLVNQLDKSVFRFDHYSFVRGNSLGDFSKTLPVTP
jgi:hypothetical protein